MENMDKGLTVPKWVLINWPKIPQMPQNLSAQIVCPSPKVWDFDKKGFIGRPQSVRWNTSKTSWSFSFNVRDVPHLILFSKLIGIKVRKVNKANFQLSSHTQVLYMSFDRFLLAVESRDLSQADKSIIRVSSFSILQNFNF